MPAATTSSDDASRPRRRLRRDDVVRTAVELADREGIDSLNMRQLAATLGVVPMAIYKHVANKEELLDAMVDLVVAEIGPIERPGRSWKPLLRRRILDARATMRRHPWARRVIETRTTRSPVVLAHLDSVASILLGGGLSPELAHRAMHAIGSRVWGFTQDVFDQGDGAEPDPALLERFAAVFPGLATVAVAVGHDGDTVVGTGCDDDAEFEFAIDLLLDGIERLHRRGWEPTAGPAR